MNTPIPLETSRHSLAHLLAAAVVKKYPGTKIGMGPAIDNGFYYDFAFPEGVSVTPESLPSLEKEMKKLISGNLPFTQKMFPLKKPVRFLPTIPTNLNSSMNMRQKVAM